MSDDRFAVQRTQVTSVGRLRTALMLTDIVGYSRRMHADEARAVRELRKHNEVIRDLLEAHHGREVKTMGDAFLAEFAVTDDALRCALAIHRKMEEVFNDEDPLRVRIGLHIAEVEAIGPDVIGDGVNILSRIEPQADPGGICASKEFVGELKAAEVLFTAMGPVEMKNIAKPVELMRWPAQVNELEELPATRVVKRTMNSLPSVPAASIAAAANMPRQAPEEGDEKTQMVSESQRPALNEAMFVPAALSDQPTPTRASALTALQDALPDPNTTTTSARPISRSGPNSARPLSRSSGIFVPPHVEPEDATKVLRAAEETRDALGIPVHGDEQTVTRSAVGPAKDWDMLLPARSPDANPSMHDVGGVVLPPITRSKGAVIALGAVAGGAVAMTLVVIIWMVTRPAPVPEQAVVKVVAPQPVAPVAPPTPPPPAPVAAPTPPPPAPVAEPAPAPMTLQQQVIAAVEKIQHSRQKPKQRKALLQKLDKLNKSVTRAKKAKDKKKAESALRAFLKKNKLN
ncbi:MAG: adenylate/guanylate cyclase domain-containing protein [Deltaproteobacteria bacterium]|nr:adenylate/guanylate cyclase domain-containing protein [Deltaproteobacteria bacterium]